MVILSKRNNNTKQGVVRAQARSVKEGTSKQLMTINQAN